MKTTVLQHWGGLQKDEGRGRPKTTCRRTIERERNKAEWKSWNVAKDSRRVGQRMSRRAPGGGGGYSLIRG